MPFSFPRIATWGLVGQGQSNKEIAAEFGTSEVTVKEQRGRVMLKMQVTSLADLVRIAARLRIPPPHSGG